MKMKKMMKLLLTTVAATVCVASPVMAATKTNDGYKDAYKKVAEEMKSNSTRYQLAYIDKDATPELFVVDVDTYSLYRYDEKSKKAILVDSYRNLYSLSYKNKGGAFITRRDQEAVVDCYYTYNGKVADLTDGTCHVYDTNHNFRYAEDEDGLACEVELTQSQYGKIVRGFYAGTTEINYSTTYQYNDFVNLSTMKTSKGTSTAQSGTKGSKTKGTKTKGTQASSSQVATSSDYILVNSSSKYLTSSDLAGLSAKELRIARNEICARHGRKFKDAELQKYFNSKSWYNGTIEPNKFNENKMLSEVERTNMYFISDYENSLKNGGKSSNGSSSKQKKTTSATTFAMTDSLRNKIVAYYQKNLTPNGDFVSFDIDDTQTSSTYSIVIRFQMDDATAEARIAQGLPVYPNQYIADITIDKATGDATISGIEGDVEEFKWLDWNIYR